MSVPCAVLNALPLLIALRLIVSAPLLGVLCLLLLWLRLSLNMLLLGPGLFLPVLLLVGLRPLLLLSVLLLPILLRLRLSLLCGSRLPLSAMLLGGLLLPILLRLRLRMLLCRPRLLLLAAFLFRMVLFFALVLRIGRARDSEKQRQHCGADDSNCFHRFCLLILRRRFVTRYEGEAALVIGFRPFF